MDIYEMRPEPTVKRKSPIWNILTIAVLLALCGVSFFMVTVFANPYSPLNPFPPEALPTKFVTSTPTYTPKPLEPTWTPTITIQPSPSRTKAPTWTPLSLDTPKVSVTPEEGTLEITTTPEIFPATAVVVYQASTKVHADLGCNWFGVGGKVLDAAGKPLNSEIIQLGGTIDGQPISMMMLSGHDTQEPYGPSGFEFALGAKPVDSKQELWIKLSDILGHPLSAKVYLDTYAACNKNMVFVTFTVTK